MAREILAPERPSAIERLAECLRLKLILGGCYLSRCHIGWIEVLNVLAVYICPQTPIQRARYAKGPIR